MNTITAGQRQAIMRQRLQKKKASQMNSYAKSKQIAHPGSAVAKVRNEMKAKSSAGGSVAQDPKVGRAKRGGLQRTLNPAAPKTMGYQPDAKPAGYVNLSGFQPNAKPIPYGQSKRSRGR